MLHLAPASESRTSVKARRRDAAGFSLVELAVVLLVMAVLGAVVLLGHGYVMAARERAAVDLFVKTAEAARLWSVENYGGFAYGGGAAGPVGIVALGTDYLGNIRHPWAGTLQVAPENAPADPCAANSCASIRMQVPGPIARCQDMMRALSSQDALPVGPRCHTNPLVPNVPCNSPNCFLTLIVR